MIIAVDFDGTIVQDNYPLIGKERPFAMQTLRMLQDEGHQLILWTVRKGIQLDEAVEWCRERGVEFYAVNKDFPEEDEQQNERYSRKIKVDIFIDDRNVGGLPDWGVIYQMIHEDKTLEEILSEGSGRCKNKRKWWQF
ncbi:MAG: hypothetical protein J6Y39_04835 [Bacteroidaceae bacterium]|nr:hypothetical protein [Bacteroidaceae bacterium]